jgi:predicted dienelactone hydrolase
MKWVRRLLAAIAILVCGLAIAAFTTAQRSERPVGFTMVPATDAGGKPFPVAVWYPTQARAWPTTMVGVALMDVARDAPVAGSRLPLVVLSHGNGGGPGSHADLAMALAGAGYVVAAPMHAGDNYTDQSAVGSASFVSDRVRQLRATVDFMLTGWQDRNSIDTSRVGAFGFSAGGLTVMVATGARPNLRGLAEQCEESPELACALLRQAGSPLVDPANPTVDDTFETDSRIKAAVVAAPGLGFAMAPDGLGDVRVPIQLWSGDQDLLVPDATNAAPIRDALGQRVEYHLAKAAGHYSFLTPCGLIGPPAICVDRERFDRKAFHRQMNASVLAFFDKNLGAAAH